MVASFKLAQCSTHPDSTRESGWWSGICGWGRPLTPATLLRERQPWFA